MRTDEKARRTRAAPGRAVPGRHAGQVVDRRVFEHPTDLTVGAEEELLLLDPATFDLASAADALVDELAGDARFQRELSPAQIEIATGPASSSVEVVQQLGEGRCRAIAAAGGRVRLMGLGAHPFTAPWSDIGSGPRYDALLHDHALGARLGALAAGLHVHVAIDGAERAVAVYNGLRAVMPQLIALSADSPFIGGRDSGLATVRCKLGDALPRHGTGPWFADWQAYESFLSWGQTTGVVPDRRAYWWDCRLNPATGTVEVRGPDAQPSLATAAALIAVVHGLAIELSERHDAGESPPRYSSSAIEENRWRAARFGLEGELLDLDQERLAPARELIGALLDRAEPALLRHGAGGSIAHARALLGSDAPAQIREHVRRHGLRRTCEWLAERTEQSAIEHGSARA